MIHHRLSFRKCSISVIEHDSLRPARGTLLFLHGRLSSSDIWSPLIQTFQKEFNCLLIEFPGFGRSFSVDDSFPTLLENANFVVELIKSPDFSEKRPFFIVGHDAGATIGQLLAVQGDHSGEPIARGMIFLNPLSLGEEISRGSWAYFNFILHFQIVKSLEAAVGVSAEEKQKILEVWNTRVSRKSLIRAIQALQESWPGPVERIYWKKAMEAIKTPVLLLAGMKDPFISVEHSFDLMRRIPESYFFINEDCGHWPSVENPAWVISKMRDFLGRIVSQGYKKRA